MIFKWKRSLHAAAALLAFSLWPAHLAGQSAAESVRKQVRAVQVEGRAPRMDGRLDDPVWQQAAFVSDFLQREPQEGAAPTDRTEVALVYDGDALYVGTRMHSASPRDIRAPLTRRDRTSGAEQIIISLDTYLDRRTAYSFGLTAGGVRLDYYHASDSEGRRDYSFDPVWEGKVAFDSAGWTAEMRIPFSQLRFNGGAGQVWGVNLKRRIPARNEDVFWIVVPKAERGWASRFGDLVGLEGIRPSRRTELVPYVASNASIRGANEPGDPFGGNDLSARIGGDLKMGIGPNLTLEATVNPDFGQVEADPAEVNLSDFETFFSERRPFFTEGRQLLEGDGPSYFYSRRIGAAPRGRASGDFVDRPENTTILGAAKLTGRLPSGLSVGTLAALTGREYARTFAEETRVFDRVEVEPPSGFVVMRAQQEFGKSGSTAGLMLTGVRRGISSGESLSTLLNRQAYSGGGDWNLRFRDGEYELEGYAGFSYVAGDSAAVLRVQRSSARYFQRPDAHYVILDPSRTSLLGYTGSVEFGRETGRHWLWEVGGSVRSPNFELNDAGRLSTADDITARGTLTYRETEPGKLFRNYSIGLSGRSEWNFGGIRQATSPSLSASATWMNYWRSSVDLSFYTRALSDDLTRGGPLMATGAGWDLGAHLSSNPARTSQWELSTSYGRDELGGWGYYVEGEWSIRSRERWEFSIEPGYSRDVNPRQYITSRAGGSIATFDRRYIFAFLERSQISAEVRLSHIFTPALSLELYAEPFATSGRFFDYGELAAARGRELRRYGTAGTTITSTDDGELKVTDGRDRFTLDVNDFNVRSFRSNLVLRWEWRPGSTAFVVWQQRLESESPEGRLVRPSGLWEALSGRGDNFLALKVSYWFPVR